MNHVVSSLPLLSKAGRRRRHPCATPDARGANPSYLAALWLLTLVANVCPCVRVETRVHGDLVASELSG